MALFIGVEEVVVEARLRNIRGAVLAFGKRRKKEDIPKINFLNTENIKKRRNKNQGSLVKLLQKELMAMVMAIMIVTIQRLKRKLAIMAAAIIKALIKLRKRNLIIIINLSRVIKDGK